MKFNPRHIPRLFLVILSSSTCLPGCAKEKKDTLYTATACGPLGDFTLYGFGPDVPCILWRMDKNGKPPRLMSSVFIRRSAAGKLYLVCDGEENGTEINTKEAFFLLPKETSFSW